MTRKEVGELFNRIKSHYNTFTTDKYKMDDWFKQLEKYDNQDVHKKFDQHLRSETYGQYEPKISFLISGLLTFEEKNSSKGITVRCQLCGRTTDLDGYDSHYTRCSSVKYLNDKSLLYFSKEIDYQKYLNMSNIDFERNYNQMLNYVKAHSQSTIEYKLIKNIEDTRDGGTIQYDSNLFKVSKI